VTFAVMVAVAEVTGQSLTRHVDRALHVAPLARTSASYYPFLLVGVKVAGALTLAALLARALRAWAAADAGRRVLHTAGQETKSPRLRPGLSPKVWVASFALTSFVYLVHADADSMFDGRWPLLAPWLHTYALPVFAVVSVLVALAWRFASWLHEIEEFADRALARARRMLTVAVRIAVRHARPIDDAGPRRRFGLSFESRPPPLAA
jgi:hypothetical protein